MEKIRKTLDYIIKLESMVEPLDSNLLTKGNANTLSQKFINDTYIKDVNEARFHGSFNGMKHALLERVSFFEQTLMNKQISNCEFRSVTFTNMKFKKTQFINCLFNDCRFFNCAFRENVFYKCRFEKCKSDSNIMENQIKLIECVTDSEQNFSSVKNIDVIEYVTLAYKNDLLLRGHETSEFYFNRTSDCPLPIYIQKAMRNNLDFMKNIKEICQSIGDETTTLNQMKECEERIEQTNTNIDEIQSKQNNNDQQQQKQAELEVIEQPQEKEATDKKEVEPKGQERQEGEENMIKKGEYTYYKLQNGKWQQTKDNVIIAIVDGIPSTENEEVTYIDTDEVYPQQNVAGSHVISKRNLNIQNFKDKIDGHVITDSYIILERRKVFTNTKFIRCKIGRLNNPTFKSCTFEQCTFVGNILATEFSACTFLNNIIDEGVKITHSCFDEHCSFDCGERFLEVCDEQTKVMPLNDIVNKRVQIRRYVHRVLDMIAEVTKDMKVEIVNDDLKDEYDVLGAINEIATNKKVKNTTSKPSIDDYYKQLSDDEKKEFVFKLFNK